MQAEIKVFSVEAKARPVTQECGFRAGGPGNDSVHQPDTLRLHVQMLTIILRHGKPFSSSHPIPGIPLRQLDLLAC
jgi:hypothetical protein